MNVLVEHNELVRRALAFIWERLGSDAAGPPLDPRNGRRRMRLVELCDEASMRFNLSPQDALALSRALDRGSSCSGQRDVEGESASRDRNA